jgi:uncharacterized membrane-anchored protein
VRADAPAGTPPDARRAALQEARDAARKALVHGPTTVALRDQAKLALPDGYGFVPRKEAAAFMSAMGNTVNDEFLGLIVPLGDEHGHWLVTVDYTGSGYIKDDEAHHWDADKLLQNLKDGTEASNAERERLGYPGLVVTRWVEAPKYEGDTHRLVWSAEARHKSGADDDPTINYNTYLLGREGYVSLDLLTSASHVEQDKSAAHQLLAAVDFNGGKRYGDFNSSTDKVAAYGLGALIAGVAAKKLGLLALLAATVVKFAKVIAIAVAGGVALVTKWLKGRGAPGTPQA